MKRGHIVTDKWGKNKNLVYNSQKSYYAVLRVENPRCPMCIDSIELCQYCTLLPTIDVSLVKLNAGNKMRRNINQVKHVNLGELLDPQFALKLKDKTSDLPDFVKRKVANLSKNVEEDIPSNKYFLRSRNSIEANFGLVKQKNNIFF